MSADRRSGTGPTTTRRTFLKTVGSGGMAFALPGMLAGGQARGRPPAKARPNVVLTGGASKANSYQ